MSMSTRMVATVCIIVNVTAFHILEPGYLVGKSAGLVIGRSRVRILTGAAGEFSSPESTLCTDFYSVSVPTPCYRSGT